MEYKILGYNAYMMKRKYGNGRTALEFLDPEDGCPIVVASVNLPDIHMEADEVAVKNYSENQGILIQMINQGIISAPIRFEPSGFVDIPICKLLI
jgi:hypothetical protein